MRTKVIRNLLAKDAILMSKTLNDCNVNKYMNIGSHFFSVDDCTNFIKKANEDFSSYHFAVVDEDDNWVGTISLKNVDKINKNAEYAIITSQKIHGSGLAKMATHDILDFAFNKLKLIRVYLNVLEDNLRANKFYCKFGFKFEGKSRKGIFLNNHFYDLNWYSILNSDFFGED